MSKTINAKDATHLLFSGAATVASEKPVFA